MVEHDRVQEIPYRDIWVYFNCVDFFVCVGGGRGDMHVYFIPICTWLTYNSYDYSAGYVFDIMKPDNHLSIVFVMVVF